MPRFPRHRALAFLAGLSLPFHFVMSADSSASVPDDLSAELSPILAKHKVPGMVFLALRGDQTLGEGAAGVRRAGDKATVTLGDKFHLGSDTKAMTATLDAMLVEEGKLKWTATLGELFGEIAPRMRPEWKAVTLAQVLAHRAGLIANASGPERNEFATSSKSTTEVRRDLIAYVLENQPDYPPGSKYVYSNVGYMMAGAVVEKITHQSWEAVMRERLFAPLGITSGGFGGAGSDSQLDQPRGHRPDGTPVSAKMDNPAYYGPAGTAHMAIGDWAKFIALHLRGDPANPHPQPRLLKAETFAALHAVPAEGTYNAGWLVTTRPWGKGTAEGATGRVLTHSGSNTTNYCTVWIAPEINFAALVACNQGGEAAGKACDEAIGVLIKKYVKR